MAPKITVSRIGVLWRIVNDNLIIKCEKVPKLGEIVYDMKLKEVGVVRNVFGPVSQPFIEVKPNTNVQYSLGEVFYVIERAGR